MICIQPRSVTLAITKPMPTPIGPVVDSPRNLSGNTPPDDLPIAGNLARKRKPSSAGCVTRQPTRTGPRSSSAMFGSGRAAPTLLIPGIKLPPAHSASITENLCAISLCCVEDRSRLPPLTFAPVIETSSPQPPAGNSPAFVWLRMEELREPSFPARWRSDPVNPITAKGKPGRCAGCD